MSLEVVFDRDDLVVFQAKNPKRQRSGAWGRYEKYKVATTVGQARELGATAEDLRHDARHGFAAVTPALAAGAPGMAAGALRRAPEIAGHEEVARDQRSLMHDSEGGKTGYWVASLHEGGCVQWRWHPSKRKAEYAACKERRGKGPGQWAIVVKCEGGGGKPPASGPSASEQRGPQREVSGIAAEASPDAISKASKDSATQQEASGIAAEASRCDQQPFLDLALRALEHGMAKLSFF